MRSLLRKTRSLSLDPEVLSEIERTTGRVSASERVNVLLKHALEAERKMKLRDEAAEFFAGASDNQERRAFHNAAIKTWTRE